MTYKKSVCVYCGGAPNALSNPAYVAGAQELGRVMAQEHIRLVYGGSKLGMMGTIADAVMAHGGEVLGIITEHLNKIEIGHEGLTELRIVNSMHERKTMMFNESDGFAILPGGFGTLDELCEIITWKQIGLHEKPIMLIDLEQYWSPLFETFAQHMVDHHFITPAHKGYYQILASAAESRPLFQAMVQGTV